MKYDFETVIDRRNKDAWAVDLLEDDPTPPKDGYSVIPMWVADMSFATCPSIIEAFKKRIEHPCYGYFDIKDSYWDAIIDWQSKRNGVSNLSREHISYENGVLGGVASALCALFPNGTKVLIHAPVYVGFTGVFEDIGYQPIITNLVLDNDGIYRMDFDDMEKKIVENDIKVCLFCSPHNPTGRVWEKWELEKMAALFEKYGLTVISDEIWSDIVRPGYKHIPLQSINEYTRMNTVAHYAITKTFNLAGLIASYHIIYNDDLRSKVDGAIAATHLNEMNVFSQHALTAAYTHDGAVWVDELNQTLAANIDKMIAYLETKGVKTARPQGTYLILPDFSDYCAASGKSFDDILHTMWDVGVSTSDGNPFYAPCHMRMALALPPALIDEAIERMETHIFSK